MEGELAAADADWIAAALAVPPEEGEAVVDGARIETRAWGERGRPGLLLIHGAGAHADWWRAIGPILAQDYRVGAFSLSGMGGSDWRQRYSLDLFVEEAVAAADVTGLFQGPQAPLLAAHSFGGRVALRWAAGSRAERLRAAVLIDSMVRPPGGTSIRPPFDARNVRTYPSEAAILERYRLVPAQPAPIPALFDLVARRSIRQTPEGWRWRFDPHLWDRLEPWKSVEDLAALRRPIASIRGARSALMIPEVTTVFDEAAPKDSPIVVVPEAHHHLMLDQPIALIAALRGLFAAWPHKEGLNEERP